jgi:hypothetical protein
MDYSYNNLNNIYQHVLKLGMLSPPEDVIACWLLFDTLPEINKFLELGSYIGGGLAIFNEALHETGHVNVKFTGVDHLDFIGAKTTGQGATWYSDHFNRCLSQNEIESLTKLSGTLGMSTWIQDRCERLTNKKLQLSCVTTEDEVTSANFDIIHHDYGDGVEDNLATIRKSLLKLSSNGVYIVDDWCTGAPFRTWATVLAQQEGLLYPIMWGKNKVFFAKSQDVAQDIVKKICANSKYNSKLFKPMPGSNYFGPGYMTIRMHWQAIQWA